MAQSSGFLNHCCVSSELFSQAAGRKMNHYNLFIQLSPQLTDSEVSLFEFECLWKILINDTCCPLIFYYTMHA